MFQIMLLLQFLFFLFDSVKQRLRLGYGYMMLKRRFLFLRWSTETHYWGLSPLDHDFGEKHLKLQSKAVKALRLREKKEKSLYLEQRLKFAKVAGLVCSCRHHCGWRYFANVQHLGGIKAAAAAAADAATAAARPHRRSSFVKWHVS